MKRITFIFSIILTNLFVNAQITFEQSYTNSSPYDNFLIIGLENSGHKYLSLEKNGTIYSIKLYNLNHTLFKTTPIDISVFFPPQYDTITNFAYGFNVYYIAENLFDLDIEVEFLTYVWYYYEIMSSSKRKTEIYNEDGSTLFTINDACPIWPKIYGGDFQKSIFNTEEGTKMILKEDTIYKVYSLPGILPCEPCVCDSTGAGKNELNPNYNRFGLSNSYPNPTSNYTRIDYQLPSGVNKAEIVFYDTKGNEVKRFAVDRTFDHLRISTAELSSGTYFYSLQSGNGNVVRGKKMVVIR